MEFKERAKMAGFCSAGHKCFFGNVVNDYRVNKHTAFISSTNLPLNTPETLGAVVILYTNSQVRGQWFDSHCKQIFFVIFRLLLGTRFYGYLSILLEYINLFHGFQPHSKKDNFGLISFWRGGGGLSLPPQTEGEFRFPSPPMKSITL